MKFRPMQDYIVVKPEVRVKSAILEVVTSRSDQGTEGAFGTVVAVGPGKMKNGRVTPLDLTPGDKVAYGGKGLDCIKFPEYLEDGERYLIMQEADIDFVRC